MDLTATSDGSSYELAGLTMAHLGLSPEDSFTYIVTYLAPDTVWRSDNFHGINDGAVVGDPGNTPLTLPDDQFNTFNSYANTPPTLTAFAGVVDTTTVDTEVEITFNELAAQGDEADVDGTVDAFVVQSVVTGTLKIGATAITAWAFASGSNDTIDAANNAYWTPSFGANGTLNAFTVVAEDNDGAEPLGNVTAQVQVIVPNEPPTDITLNNDSVDENEPAGTVVGTFSTTDPDVGVTHTYSLVAGNGDTDNASFTIVGNELRTATTFDYETKDTYSIRIQTDDNNGGTYEEVFTISVSDVNEGLLKVTKYIPTTGLCIFGEAVNAALDVTALSTPGTVTITVHPDQFHPEVVNDSVKRWFEITTTGVVGTFDLTLSYDDTELGSEVEADLCLWRYDGGTWQGPHIGDVETGDNFVTVYGITEFSDWVMRDNAIQPPVPEIATILLICTGLLALGGYVCFRRGFIGFIWFAPIRVGFTWSVDQFFTRNEKGRMQMDFHSAYVIAL